MVVLTTTYNCEQFVEKSLLTIMSQSFSDFKCYITDDLSTDNTVEVIKKTINGDDRFILIENKEKMYQPGNYDQVIRNNNNIMDDEICVEVDGDDWLPDRFTLQRINDFYKNNDVWLANGSFKYHDGRHGFSKPPSTFHSVRKQTFTLSHIRTWKAFLWRKIIQDDLKDEDGKYWSVAGDLAFMFPMFEMSGKEHYGFMKDINYVYNESNPLNDHKVNMSKVTQIVNKIRNKKPYKKLPSPLSAKNLFKWNRFDLPIKHLFLKFYNKGIKSSFGEDIYKEHLKLWNNFKEYNNPNKNTYESFKTDFINIFNDVKNDKFDWSKSPVITDIDGFLLNGSHRTSAAYALNKSLDYIQGSEQNRDGQKVCDYKMFNSLGLSQEYQDEAALELIRINPKHLIINLFPSATHNRNLVENIITKYCGISYKKDIWLNDTGAFNYTLQLYKGEKWAGDWSNNFGGFRHKARLCFTNQTNPMTVYLVNLSDLDIARQIKEEIRGLYSIGNHSVHINDTPEETLRLARCIFNKNSIHFLNNSQLQHYPKFLSQLDYYENYIKSKNLNFEDYCITASGVLSLYGLREGNDLDYLHFNSPKIIGHQEIHSHNEYGIGRYSKNIDDIIFNPTNHFYYGNLKVVSLDIVKRLKEKRGEEKDKIDLQLINKIL